MASRLVPRGIRPKVSALRHVGGQEKDLQPVLHEQPHLVPEFRDRVSDRSIEFILI